MFSLGNFMKYILRMSPMSQLNCILRWVISRRFCMSTSYRYRGFLSGVITLIKCLFLICTVWVDWCKILLILLYRLIGQRQRLSDGESPHLFFRLALIDGCNKLVGSASRQAVAVYTTLTLIRYIYLSTLFPERRLLTDRLLGLCGQRLGLQPCRIA